MGPRQGQKRTLANLSKLLKDIIERIRQALAGPIQIRKLIKADVIQADLFDEQGVEVTHEGKRLVMRCDPATQRKERHRRDDKLHRLARRVTERNQFVAQSARAKPEAGLRQLKQWVSQHKLSGLVELTLNQREIELHINAQAKQEAYS